jgi:hypothetical protein
MEESKRKKTRLLNQPIRLLFIALTVFLVFLCLASGRLTTGAFLLD